MSEKKVCGLHGISCYLWDDPGGRSHSFGTANRGDDLLGGIRDVVKTGITGTGKT